MSFWFSPELGDFLIKGFVVDTTKAFVATCFGLGAIAVLLEVLKFWRTKVKHKSALKQSLNAQIGGSETSALLSGSRLRGNLERVLNITFEVVMYLTQESFNWIVMLAVMGYNGYIFVSVIAGAGLGYALFGESLANSKIQNVKMKAAMMSCGDCQVKEEEETDENDPGQSDPPTDSQAIPSISGSISRSVMVHCDP